jgi:MFS transporter, ceroid-lipofuscinosis neuronal protein 7
LLVSVQKVIGRQPQGELQGWFASAGSLARMIFPIMAGYIAEYKGIDPLFLLLAILLTISAILILMAKDTLLLLAT